MGAYMKICSINELKEHDILARDVMADKYNVFLYRNTILNKKYIEKLKGLNVPYVYIQDNIPEEEVAVLKKEIEEKSRSKVKEVILRHTYSI